MPILGIDDTLFMLESLFSIALIEGIFLFMLLTKTPAWKFFKASLGHKLVLIHPKENKYIDFITPKTYSSLAFVKGRGYYAIDPKHVYIEGKSKVPCAIVYGNHAVTLDLTMADITSRLSSFGVKSADGLQKIMDSLKATGQALKINIFGESIDASTAMDYFNTSERSDFIEAEIQRRTAAQIIQKLRGPGDIFKWAVILIIVMIGAVLAYGMLTSILGNTGVQPTNYITSAAKVISNPAGTGTGQGVVIS